MAADDSSRYDKTRQPGVEYICSSCDALLGPKEGPVCDQCKREWLRKPDPLAGIDHCGRPRG